MDINIQMSDPFSYGIMIDIWEGNTACSEHSLAAFLDNLFESNTTENMIKDLHENKFFLIFNIFDIECRNIFNLFYNEYKE